MTEVSVATWNLHQAIDRRPANVEATWRFLEDDIEHARNAQEADRRLRGADGLAASADFPPGK